MFHKDNLSNTLAITMLKFCIDVCLLYVVLSSSSQGYEMLEPVPGSEFTEGKKRKKKKKSKSWEVASSQKGWRQCWLVDAGLFHIRG